MRPTFPSSERQSWDLRPGLRGAQSTLSCLLSLVPGWRETLRIDDSFVSTYCAPGPTPSPPHALIQFIQNANPVKLASLEPLLPG